MLNIETSPVTCATSGLAGTMVLLQRALWRATPDPLERVIDYR